jgi:F0F1-type ATP synthase assembly protein I
LEQYLNSRKNPNYVKNLALVGALSWIGFVTLIIAVGALLGGLWLDAHFGTKPLFTVLLLILSIPINIYFQFRVAMNLVKQIQTEMPNPASKSIAQEDE